MELQVVLNLLFIVLVIMAAFLPLITWVERKQSIMRLLCEFQVDLEDFGGGAAFADELRYLQPLARDGLVRIDGTRP